MPIGISDIVAVAGFVIDLFSGPRTAPAQQCVEAPKEQVQVVQQFDTEARHYSGPYTNTRDYCKEVSDAEWNGWGQQAYDAFEGTRSKDSICKTIVMARDFEAKGTAQQ